MDAVKTIGKRPFSLERAESIFGWKLILPAILIIACLILYPIIYNIYLSFLSIEVVAPFAGQ